MPEEKFALVTGSSRGIGRAVNETLARDGYTCVVHYRRDETGAQDAVRSLKELGARAVTMRADLGDAGDVESMQLALMLITKWPSFLRKYEALRPTMRAWSG